MDDSSTACLLSHLAVLQHLVESGEDMLAVFEDDARLGTALSAVLDALEGKADKFDVVKLQRRRPAPFFPIYQLTRHSLGRLKYDDHGGEGYVISRAAASHLLEQLPTPWEIDYLIMRFWDNGLRNVLYVNPPVVAHDELLPSYIEGQRAHAQADHDRSMRRRPAVLRRLGPARLVSRWQRWRRWRELRRADRDVDPFGF